MYNKLETNDRGRFRKIINYSKTIVHIIEGGVGKNQLNLKLVIELGLGK